MVKSMPSEMKNIIRALMITGPTQHWPGDARYHRKENINSVINGIKKELQVSIGMKKTTDLLKNY